MKNNKLVEIQFRKLTLKDIDNKYFEWFNNSAVNKYTSHRNYVYTKEMAIDYYNNILKKKKIIHFIIQDIKNNKPIGICSLQSLNNKFKSAELARFIGDKNYLNLGLGKKITEYLVNYAFTKTNFTLLWVGNNINNIGAIKSNKKNGFKDMHINLISKLVDKIDKNSVYLCKFKDEKI